MAYESQRLPREHLFACPHCNSHELNRRGIYKRGKTPQSIWSCKGCGKFTIESKLMEALLDDQDPDLALARSAIRDLEKGHRYFITSAMNNTGVHAAYWKNVLHYVKVNESELIIRPCRYRNPNSPRMAASDAQNYWWPSEVYEFLVQDEVQLHQLLTYMGHVPINATNRNPLSGLEGLSRGSSAIFGHPQLAMKSVATPQHEMAKLIYTTGSVSARDYSESKTGIQGEFHHTLGGIVVEKEGGRFHIRPVLANRAGEFCDLVWHYHDGTDTRIKRVAAMKIADEHVPFEDPVFNTATYYAQDAQVKVAKPKVISREDVVDSFAISHWHGNKAITRWAKRQAGMDDLREELLKVRDHIVKTTPEDTLNLFTASNHNEHILRWLSEKGDPRQDPQNLLIWCELMGAVLRETKMGPHGTEHPDPFALWLAPQLEEAEIAAKFLEADESFLVEDWEMGMHGHYGVSGARGSVVAFTKIGVKVLMGHIHRATIDKNVWSGGAGPRKLEYAQGPSAWTQTNLVLYQETKRPSHWHIVQDSWHGNPRLCAETGVKLRPPRAPRAR